MSYPQANADDSVVKGSKFFRLNTLLASPGDIYESSQGANAMAIGPDSDISEVLVAYPDPTQPTGINQLVVSNTRSMVGLVPVNNTGQAYLPANRPGKIYMSPNNLWNPDFMKPDTGTFTHLLETPRLDVIQYFQPQASLVPQRRDKTYTYQSVVVPDGDGSIARITVPFYGRKYASITILHASGPQGGLQVEIDGVILTYGDTSTGTSTSGFLVPLAARDFNNPIGSSTPYTFTVGPAGLGQLQTATDGSQALLGSVGGGAFDLLSVALIRPAAPAVLGQVFCEITVSDVAAPIGGTILTVPLP